MLKVVDSSSFHKKTMKNTKSSTGKQSGNIAITRKDIQGVTNSNCHGNRPESVKFCTPLSVKKPSSLVKSQTNTISSSQESLSSSGASVRRKTPATSHISTSVRIGSKNNIRPTPIRMINSAQTNRSVLSGKKTIFKQNNQTNMRRAVSKDSVDRAGIMDKEKENVKVGTGRNKNSNNCITILQMEKEKAQMQHQISELVKNAESKKAEIATLKIEIKKLKDLKSDDAVDQLRQELEAVQMENQSLRERLVQLGIPLEMTALSDNQKEQILIQRSLSGTFLHLDKDQLNSVDSSKFLDTDVGEASGINLPSSGRSLAEWERGSSSSLSEMSVACLQDRIVQMEETHHSTNEELQATLQELTDLQDQLTDFQLDNERMSEEKAVLLESLCSQTEKLEECRTQITQLKQLLFQQLDQDGKMLTASERESHYIDILKKSEEAYDNLLMKQEELSTALQAAKNDTNGSQTDILLLRDRTKLLESTVESVNADKRLLESHLKDSQEQLSAKQIEISQLKLQLENEQQKVLELQKEREASATSELNSLLEQARHDKEKVEERAMKLQEQLSLSQREVNRYKDQVHQLQEEIMVTKNNAHKQVSDMEYLLDQMSLEKEQIHQNMSSLDNAYQQLKQKCQHHLEDKRELKANVGELQKKLNETIAQVGEINREMEEAKKKHLSEIEDWKKFQVDLLTTVRVANDFKNEAQCDVERLISENKMLNEKNSKLETEVEKMKAKPEMISPPSSKSNLAFSVTDGSTLSSLEKDLNVAARRQLNSNKRNDRGVANQLSVRSLIESIESATKQVKAQGPSSSCSSSSSSLNSIASDSRLAANSILLSNNSDLFIKASLCSTTDSSILKDNKVGNQHGRMHKMNSEPSSDQMTTATNKSDVDPMKPLLSHPVSILASKLDPMRRNSYGDINEKKDPLSSLTKGGGSKRNALLKWCQNKTLGYKSIDITNFSSSWNDGLAFCALMHSYLPNLVPYDELDNKDKKKNFTFAFQAAESVGIPTSLNINDLVCQERPDWQSIMSYVTSIYKHFET